jgi:hypothetical protein
MGSRLGILEPLLRCLDCTKSSPSRIRPTNHTNLPLASGPVPHSRSVWHQEHKCSRFAQSQWFYSSPEEHDQSPSHLKSWFTVNEVRILTHVSYHQNQSRTGQRNITDFLPPTVQTAPTLLQPSSVTTMSVSIANAPLTREPGRFTDDGLRARR